jgi:hypothetical protein
MLTNASRKFDIAHLIVASWSRYIKGKVKDPSKLHPSSACYSLRLYPGAKMAPILSFIVGSLLAARALAEPFEKLFSTPKGVSLGACHYSIELSEV